MEPQFCGFPFDDLTTLKL